MRERALQIKTPTGWKTAGKVMKIRGEWAFYREVTDIVHALHTFNAWSIQASLLPVLDEDGVKWIYQYERDADRVTRISLDDFKAKCIERMFGEGTQLYVSTKYFETVPNMKRVRKWINSVELVA